jgi:hypothetical protein
MWMLWLIPVTTFGIAVAVFYDRVMRNAPPSILAAQTTQLIPLLLPETGSVPESLSVCPDCWSDRLGAERMSPSPSGFGRSTGDRKRCTGRRAASGLRLTSA